MIEQYSHTVNTSFSLWFDNFLLKRGQAFSNKTGQLYYYEDERVNSVYKTFGSPFKQWVSDSSISGVDIPTGLYVNSVLTNRNDGLILDFENGRTLISGASSLDSVTGSFSVKDFNIYFTNDNEEDLIIERKFVENPRLYSLSRSYIKPYEPVLPAIFLSMTSSKNKPFAFGGLDQSNTMVNAVIFAEDSYQLDGVLSIFADSNNEVITKIPFSGFPYDEYGDLKNGSYSYEDLKSQFTGEEPIFVEDVETAKLSDKARKTVANNMHIGFIDFQLSNVRYPRI